MTAVNNPKPEEVSVLLNQYMLSKKKFPGDAAIVARYGKFVGSHIESHVFLERAMTHGRKKIRETAAAGKSFRNGTVILADSMGASKGRFARVWHAPTGGVWGCLIHANTLLPVSRTFIPLAAGLACCEAVRECGAETAMIRWVNDVLMDGRKLAGFLVETFTEEETGEEYNLVGFGININNNRFPDELSPTAVSLAELLGREIDLSSFTALFLARLAWYFGLLHYEEACQLKGEGFSGSGGEHLLLGRWKELSDTIGRRVRYGFDVMEAPQYEGEVLGIDLSGGLIIRLDDGFEKTEYSGEVRYL
ncbi:biotin--[acetyl-CoA-carboxylase] ligase [Desulfomarina sp.]